MASYFRKLLILTSSCSLAFGMLQADIGGNSYNCTSLEGDSCDEFCCDNWYLFGDYLYWKAGGHGLTYGVSTATLTDKTIPLLVVTTDSSKLKKVKPSFDSGFRVGLGYASPCNCWSLNAAYTHFSSNASSSFSKPKVANMGLTMSFVPSWGQIPAFTATTAGAADAHWRLHLNELDLYVARSFCFKGCLSVSPLIGLRAVRVDQKYNINYNSSVTVPVKTSFSETIHLKSNFEGAGLLVGVDSTLELCWNWSLYGKATASLLYSRFEGRTTDNFERVAPSPQGTLRNSNKQKDHFWDGEAIADLGIGFQWSTPLLCNTCLTLKLGWEGHYFFDQTRFYDSIAAYPELRHNDLNLQGLVAELGLGF